MADNGNDDPAKGKVTKVDIAYLRIVKDRIDAWLKDIDAQPNIQELRAMVGVGDPDGSETPATAPPGAQPAPSALLAGNNTWSPAATLRNSFQSAGVSIVNQVNWLKTFLRAVSADIDKVSALAADAELHNEMTAQQLLKNFSDVPALKGLKAPGSSAIDPAQIMKDLGLGG